jgi:CysZ protein
MNQPRPGTVVDGVQAFLGGIGFVMGTPGVWLYALVPMLLVFVLMVLAGIGGGYAAWHWSDHLIGQGVGGGHTAGKVMVALVFGLIGMIVGLVVALGVAQPLSGFALEAIAHAQEVALTGRSPVAPGGFAGALWRALLVTAFTLAAAVAGALALWLPTLLFPPAVVVTAPLQVVWGGWLLAWNFLDYPLGLHGLGVRGRLHWVGRNWPAVTAFGVVWAAVLLIPGVIILLLPMGVAGAARLVALDRPG